MGWKVLRFWEHEIEKDRLSCAKTVISTLEALQRKTDL
jgi:very-short-patch-repair endonuclease